MATDPKLTRKGVTISCSTSAYPAPMPQASWPVPAFPAIQTSLLNLSLVVVAGQGSQGILIQSVGNLPGSTGAVWTLFHQYFQGTQPSTMPTADSIPLTLVGQTINQTLHNAMNGATHLFWLQSVDGTATTVYPTAAIVTQVDPTQGTLTALAASLSTMEGVIDGFATSTQLTPTQVATAQSDYNALVADLATVEAQVISVGLPASTYAALVADLAALNTYLHGLANWGSTTLNVTIVPATWESIWNTVFNDFTSVEQAIAAKAASNTSISSGNGGNLIPNGDCSFGPVSGLPGNCIYDTSTYISEVLTGYLGCQYVRSSALIPTAIGYDNAGAPISGHIPCVQGDVFNLAYYFMFASSIGYHNTLQLAFCDASGNAIGSGIVVTTGLSAFRKGSSNNGFVGDIWNNISAQITAPANAAYCYLYFPSQRDDLGHLESNCWIGAVSVTVSVAPASTTVAGHVKVGAGLAVAADGTLSTTGTGGGSYTLPAATASTLGGVKVGSGLSVAGDGTLTNTGTNPGIATASNLGLVRIGTGLSVDISGMVTATPSATTWGAITGTLSSQGDLNNALNQKQGAAQVLTNLTNAGNAAGVLLNNGSGGISWANLLNSLPPMLQNVNNAAQANGVLTSTNGLLSWTAPTFVPPTNLTVTGSGTFGSLAVTATASFSQINCAQIASTGDITCLDLTTSSSVTVGASLNVHSAATITGNVSALAFYGSGAGLSNLTVPIASICAGGTADPTTFLCGDGIWTVPPPPTITWGMFTSSVVGSGNPSTFLRGDGSWQPLNFLTTVSWPQINATIGGTGTTSTYLRGDGTWQTVAPNPNGIQFQGQDYTQIYLGMSGTANQGVNSNITSPTGTLVTQSGIRSLMYNNTATPGQGWTWETWPQTMGGTKSPSIVAEMNTSGSFRTIGGISATTGTFSGSLFTPLAFCGTATTTANFRGNWAGANYWGIGATSGHALRLAMSDISGNYLAAPGDMSLQVDGTISATQFNGSGAGLTGSAPSLTAGSCSGTSSIASSLNIGGNIVTPVWQNNTNSPYYVYSTNANGNASMQLAATSAMSVGYASTVGISTNRTDNAWYQAMWATSGGTTCYSTSAVMINSSGYGGILFGSNWAIYGNATYGLYSNTGLNAAGGLWDSGNRVYSAANPQPSATANGGTATYASYNTSSQGLIADAGHSFNASGAGYQRLSNGLIIQWGPSTGSTSISFPISFPSYCVSVALSSFTGSPITISASPTTTGFTINAASGMCKWMAIGY